MRTTRRDQVILLTKSVKALLGRADRDRGGSGDVTHGRLTQIRHAQQGEDHPETRWRADPTAIPPVDIGPSSRRGAASPLDMDEEAGSSDVSVTVAVHIGHATVPQTAPEGGVDNGEQEKVTLRHGHDLQCLEHTR